MIARLTSAALVLSAIAASSATAQQRAPDTLQLRALEAAAVHGDPRLRQLDLQRSRTDLRLRDLDAERLPSLSADGQAQYQSDVIRLPVVLPGGQVVPTPPHDTYDAHLGAQERLIDPTVGPRRDVARAELAQSQSQVRTSLYALRQQVEQSFFDAVLLDARASELETTIADLEAQLQLSRARVREGTALHGDAASIEAELLRCQQDLAQLRSDRSAALAVLGDLTGRSIATNDVLALPDLAEQVARVRAATDSAWSRPELEQFARTRDVLAAQEEALSAQAKPRVSAFARLGYGRPGLNFLSNRFDSYWLAGVQLQWAPWSWGTTERDREALELQRQIVETEQSAFVRSLHRVTARDLATIDHLEATLATDERIIALRDTTAREARLRYDEGVITAAEYVDRQTDVLNARLARATHRVQLAQARAHYLTTLGIELR